MQDCRMQQYGDDMKTIKVMFPEGEREVPAEYGNLGELLKGVPHMGYKPSDMEGVQFGKTTAGDWIAWYTRK